MLLFLLMNFNARNECVQNGTEVFQDGMVTDLKCKKSLLAMILKIFEMNHHFALIDVETLKGDHWNQETWSAVHPEVFSSHKIKRWLYTCYCSFGIFIGGDTSMA